MLRYNDSLFDFYFNNPFVEWTIKIMVCIKYNKK